MIETAYEGLVAMIPLVFDHTDWFIEMAKQSGYTEQQIKEGCERFCEAWKERLKNEN